MHLDSWTWPAEPMRPDNSASQADASGLDLASRAKSLDNSNWPAEPVRLDTWTWLADHVSGRPDLAIKANMSRQLDFASGAHAYRLTWPAESMHLDLASKTNASDTAS